MSKERWVICPVVETPLPGGRVHRRGSVFNLFDSGVPPLTGEDEGIPYSVPVPFRCSAAISDGQLGQENGWALVRVRGEDFSNIDADPTIISVFEQDDDDDAPTFLIEGTPNSLGWTQGKINRIKRRLEDRGVVVDTLTNDTPLWQWLELLGKRVSPHFTPRGNYSK